MIRQIKLINGKILKIDNTCTECGENKLSDKSILYQINHNIPLTCYECGAKNRLNNPIKYINYDGVSSRHNKAYKQSHHYH